MRRWFAMDVQFLTDPKVERLGERHGPLGPLTIVALFCGAKTQGASGTVRNTYRALGHQVFASPEDVRSVIASADEFGLIEAQNIGERGFEAKLPAWHRWQEAFRKRESRQNVRKRPKTSAAVGTETVTETGTVAIREEVSSSGAAA